MGSERGAEGDSGQQGVTATADAHPPATRAPPSASFPTMVSSSNGEHTIQQQAADGWVAVVSRTRPGQVTYKHIETGARTGKIPTLLNQQGIIDRSLHVVNMRNKKAGPALAKEFRVGNFL